MRNRCSGPGRQACRGRGSASSGVGGPGRGTGIGRCHCARLVELRERRDVVKVALDAARSSSSVLVTLHALAKRLKGAQVDGVSAKFLELPLEEQRELVRQLPRGTVNEGRGIGGSRLSTWEQCG
jgi:hypothetical protein